MTFENEKKQLLKMRLWYIISSCSKNMIFLNVLPTVQFRKSKQLNLEFCYVNCCKVNAHILKSEEEFGCFFGVGGVVLLGIEPRTCTEHSAALLPLDFKSPWITELPRLALNLQSCLRGPDC